MIRYIEHHIVNHCNLNCAGCSHFSCIADKWVENIEDFKKDFTQLRDMTNAQIGIIRIMGGEPLLHPEWDKFLILTRKLFPYSRIELVTNGVLVKKYKQKLIQVCNDNKIVICISDYGLFDIGTLLEGFQYTRFYGKAALYNICLDLNGSQDPTTAFNNCDLHVNRWDYFQNGRFYPCCMGANIQTFDKHFGTHLFTGIDDISISIYDHSLEEIEQFMNTPKQMCKYCDTIKRGKAYSAFRITEGHIGEWLR